VLRIRDVNPGSKYLPIPDPGSKVKKISDPGSASASKNLSVLTESSRKSDPGTTLTVRFLCRERRQMVYERVVLKYGFKCLFLESICDSTELIEANIMDIKVHSTYF
jgi:hypothetical protein